MIATDIVSLIQGFLFGIAFSCGTAIVVNACLIWGGRRSFMITPTVTLPASQNQGAALLSVKPIYRRVEKATPVSAPSSIAKTERIPRYILER
jgi:hypothetical protein